jgi:hypothetical protein
LLDDIFLGRTLEYIIHILQLHPRGTIIIFSEEFFSEVEKTREWGDFL